MQSKRPEHLFTNDEVRKICHVGVEGVRIIEESSFSSQNSFKISRAIRAANILNDYFELEHFRDKRILELGPGHYAFALLARHLGAKVTCVERDSHFISLGRYLGFEVIEMDFNDLGPATAGVPYDGMWIKGTFNSCNYRSDDDVRAFVAILTSLVKPDGWSWLTVVNKGGKDESSVSHRIEVQRQALIDYGWLATSIADEDRPLYALKYTGSPNVYSRNIPAYSLEADGAIGSEYFHEDQNDASRLELTGSVDKIPASQDNPFNKVQRIWKPTPEYFVNPWQYYTEFIDIVRKRKGRFITMSQALAGDYDTAQINVLLDHHIDFYPIETEVMCRWELENDVVSSIYLFNRFEYTDTLQRKIWKVEDLNIPFYQHLERNGFEIGYHQNALGLVRNERLGRIYSREINDEDYASAKKIFAEDVDNLRRYFNIRTFIPHGAGEGNAHLTDLPSGYEDLVWVYNNAHRNKTCTPPLKWRNYSDSCGVAAQRLLSFRGQYLSQTDNLHLNAYLLEPGLNHILIHAGRSSKGMPYELYEQRTESLDLKTITRNEFSGIGTDLPLSISKLVTDWATAQSEEIRSPFGKIFDRKYYVLSDDFTVLRDHMAHSDYVIPIHVQHRKIRADEKVLFQVPRPVSSNFHLPTAKEDFPEAFQKFYNTLFSPHILLHLTTCDLPFEVVHLSNIRTDRIRLFKELVIFLKHLSPDAAVYIRIRSSSISMQKFEHSTSDFFKTDLGKQYICKVSEINDELDIIVTNRQTTITQSLPLTSMGKVMTPKVNELLPEEQEKLNQICKARGEDVDSVIQRFGYDGIRKAPRRFSKHMDALRRTVFSEAGIRDGLAYVKMPGGRIFYGYTSKPNHRRAYAYVKDVIPAVLSEDTYLLGLDIAQRYATDFSWPPEEILPPKGGTVVECGAYLGHKTIRFAEELVGQNGKILAIEMMPDNVEILRRNIRENGFEGTIDVIEAGVWKEAGKLPVKGKGRQRNTFLEMEKLKEDLNVVARVDTIDALLSEWGQPCVDLMFITINGAEVEALQGMNAAMQQVRAIFIAAPYKRDGRPSVEICKEIVKSKGFRILKESKGNRLFLENSTKKVYK